MSEKLPMRFRILHYFSGVPDGTVESAMTALSGEYGKEGQFRREVFEEHLMSMKAGGLLDAREPAFDDDGRLVQRFAITEAGRSRMQYLPPGWKP